MSARGNWNVCRRWLAMDIYSTWFGMGREYKWSSHSEHWVSIFCDLFTDTRIESLIQQKNSKRKRITSRSLGYRKCAWSATFIILIACRIIIRAASLTGYPVDTTKNFSRSGYAVDLLAILARVQLNLAVHAEVLPRFTHRFVPIPKGVEGKEMLNCAATLTCSPGKIHSRSLGHLLEHMQLVLP